MEDNNEGKKGEPLLYIDQPVFLKPELTMQDYYYSTETTTNEKEEKPAKNDEQVKNQEKVPNPEKQIKKDVVIPRIDEVVVPEKKEEPPLSAAAYFRRNSSAPPRKQWNLTPVKSFKEMSIQEKLFYLSRFPVSQPPYPCEFVTEQDRIRGTLVKYEEERITVKTFSEEVVEIFVSDIKAIRIIF